MEEGVGMTKQDVFFNVLMALINRGEEMVIAIALAKDAVAAWEKLQTA